MNINKADEFQALFYALEIEWRMGQTKTSAFMQLKF